MLAVGQKIQQPHFKFDDSSNESSKEQERVQARQDRDFNYERDCQKKKEQEIGRPGLKNILIRSDSVIAYTLAFILIFLLDFEATVEFPIVLVQLILIAIAGFPGKSVGGTLGGALYGGLGVLLGCLFFYLLALAHESRVGQGFMFIFMLYFFSYIKAISMKYFAFSLLGIVVSFSGIYTSVLLGGFSPGYLISYLIAYGYGFAIVFFVNWFIFPISAERELRETLVASLERISTFAHLVAKTYSLEITEEEKKVRDQLHQAVRGDLGLLSAKLGDTSIELNYTRYSIEDYAAIIKNIRAMTLGLITAYSALKEDSDQIDASKFTTESFKKLRRAADLIVRDLVIELDPNHSGESYHSPAPGSRSWKDFSEPAEASGEENEIRSSQSTVAEDESIRLKLAAQLSREVSEESEKDFEKNLNKVEIIRNTWKEFTVENHAKLREVLASGIIDDDVLLLEKPQMSLNEAYLRTKTTGQVNFIEVGKSKNEIVIKETMRTFSFLFGFTAIVDSLAELHDLIVPAPGEARKSKSLHVHLFESIPSASLPKMKLLEALCVLAGKEYIPTKQSISRRFVAFSELISSPRSLYALKTAVAVSILAVFVLAPSLSAFFVEYSLTGGLITLVVAMAPTLGQTILTFGLQIAGTGIGSIYGMIILYIFRGVGGYAFNPYGLTALIFLFAIPMSYVLYAKPQLFAFALLSMNAVGTIVITEYVYNDVPGQIRPGFDSPALRCGKALVSMSLALVVAAVFQLLILRQSSRSTLRIELSRVTFALSSYNIILQALLVVIVPLDLDSDLISPEQQKAVEKISGELIAREGQIQLQILSLFPLMAFSAVEFDFGRKFEQATYSKLIRSHQLILDRFRECRSALGTKRFDSEVHKHFTSVLTPYRKNAQRYSRALFFLTASSLQLKRSLPAELPSIRSIGGGISHDALILSNRLLKDKSLKHLLLNRDWENYFFFLSSYSAIGRELEELEENLRVLFANEDFEKLD